MGLPDLGNKDNQKMEGFDREQWNEMRKREGEGEE